MCDWNGGFIEDMLDGAIVREAMELREPSSDADDTAAIKTLGELAQAKRDLARMQACERLLDRVFSDHGFMDYDEVRPDELREAGYDLDDDEGEPASEQTSEQAS